MRIGAVNRVEMIDEGAVQIEKEGAKTHTGELCHRSSDKPSLREQPKRPEGA
jgi:hypothetical protein